MSQRADATRVCSVRWPLLHIPFTCYLILAFDLIRIQLPPPRTRATRVPERRNGEADRWAQLYRRQKTTGHHHGISRRNGTERIYNKTRARGSQAPRPRKREKVLQVNRNHEESSRHTTRRTPSRRRSRCAARE